MRGLPVCGATPERVKTLVAGRLDLRNARLGANIPVEEGRTSLPRVHVQSAELSLVLAALLARLPRTEICIEQILDHVV